MRTPAQSRLALQRLEIAVSGFTAALEEYGPGPGGRERAIAITNAEQALLWAREGVKLGTSATS